MKQTDVQARARALEAVPMTAALTHPCGRCSAQAEHIGTSQGSVWYLCPRCQHVTLVTAQREILMSKAKAEDEEAGYGFGI